MRYRKENIHAGHGANSQNDAPDLVTQSKTAMSTGPYRRKKHEGESYYGGQNGAGHYQKLINHIPKVDIYVEAFLGMSGVFNNMTMAAESWYFGFDLDPKIVSKWESFVAGPKIRFVNCDYTAAAVVASMFPLGKKMFVHYDPPYRNTKSPKQYNFDLETDRHYRQLAQHILSMSGSSIYIMVSHWRDELLDEYLNEGNGFRHIPFKTMGRRGPIDNGIYINYDAGNIELADYSYAGSDFTKRQRIKRKVERNYKKIMSLPIEERNYLLNRLMNDYVGPKGVL